MFRRQIDGKDLPANLTFPNVKIQSNFTFSMASSGDPSTFTFTMDAFPGYTYFDRKKKVLCAIQIVDDIKDATKNSSFSPKLKRNQGKTVHKSSTLTYHGKITSKKLFSYLQIRQRIQLMLWVFQKL